MEEKADRLLAAMWLLAFCVSISLCHKCAIPAGGRGSGSPKNHKNIGFLSKPGLDPLKITKLSSQHSMLGHHRHPLPLWIRAWCVYVCAPMSYFNNSRILGQELASNTFECIYKPPLLKPAAGYSSSFACILSSADFFKII